MSLHYEIEIEQQPIELYKLLKIANLVAGGGEAKIIISQGYVILNGEIETQKRKKVFSGDIIEFNGDVIELICHNQPVSTPPKATSSTNQRAKSSKNRHNQTKEPQQKKQKPTKQANKDTSGKRRAINF